MTFLFSHACLLSVSSYFLEAVLITFLIYPLQT
uniref:Uncharacterized protein n=1 Tax=Arundo donax TaxID=35708 RepID=A0A0A8YBQ4_ARUDO